MMKTRAASLSFAERCRNILAANWRAHLNTIKADAKGSKDEIYTSKVHYAFHKGRPYLWIGEGDLHNMNTIIDERGSLSICTPIPGPLMGLLKSIRKLPARVALSGDVVRLKDKKVQAVVDSIKESILLEQKTASQASYTSSAVLSSADISCRSRSEIFQEILNESDSYNIYKFDIGSCTYIDGRGGIHDVELDNFEAPTADLLLPFSGKLIDGINQSQTRRRALMLFCFEYHNVSPRDALMLSVDRKGFNVLAKVPETVAGGGGAQQYQWKEFRFSFKEEAKDVEAFCQMLVELEEEALQHVNSYSGLG
ncbi:uncharacterized protein LOC109709318 [Ananas comosus]|uniref:Uncharacterized protein LOC109709318 n=1 Tax=Ananas comosus TaxID=4615 RepID=A0A6P5EUB9_ANACO|nr:uncharacterized protein LOC109709318 [Ananas comosus]XP_020087083.1 uncharacterized protein LOC109709318 [Ananas comosus]